jgi:soluble lytic murein transglycosylase
MRRAYPQHRTAAAGARLPDDLMRVIFPLEYWDSIQRYAAARDLDPYLVAALIGQESTFDPEIRSAANAWGLMQIVPSTGRRLARSLGIPRFRTAMLTQPDLNIRLGTTYFARLVDQFGAEHLALASYNAGESRVVRWIAERPGLDRDEFIDDIPFPETQNYVKRILGTAEDYRALYGRRGP